LPSTDDARLWIDDHDDSKNPCEPCDELPYAFEKPRSAESSLYLSLISLSVAREGCFWGSGEPLRDAYGEGVVPRDRGGVNPLDAADKREFSVCSPFSSSSSLIGISRLLRGRIDVFSIRLELALDVAGSRKSGESVLELIPIIICCKNPIFPRFEKTQACGGPSDKARAE
jgi:hypothetical protein